MVDNSDWFLFQGPPGPRGHPGPPVRPTFKLIFCMYGNGTPAIESCYVLFTKQNIDFMQIICMSINCQIVFFTHLESNDLVPCTTNNSTIHNSSTNTIDVTILESQCLECQVDCREMCNMYGYVKEDGQFKV